MDWKWVNFCFGVSWQWGLVLVILDVGFLGERLMWVLVSWNCGVIMKDT